MNLANYFTLLRLVISPIFLLVYLEPDWFGLNSQWLPYALLALLGISELSDFFDGFFARKFNQVTELGKILDPMADSISHISMFLAFTQDPIRLPIWTVFIFMYRDFVVSTLRTACALRGYTLAARISGKIKAGVQASAILIITLLLIPAASGEITQSTLQLFATVIVALAAIYTLYSGFDYVFANRFYIYRLLKQPKKASDS
ncbi:MAG: CDP-diacylglycerol--glycerol-3-phosphate 3-phosphatidyltransferase [Parachlamydiales bacterium]